MAMAKIISDHKINTALGYSQAPINDLAKLKTLLDKSAADHLHNLTVVDTTASQNLEHISMQLTTKQLAIDTELQNLLGLYNMRYQELSQLVNSMSAYSNFDNTTGSCSFTGVPYTGNNNGKHTPEYIQYTNNIGRINNLVTELISINGSFYYGIINSTNIPNNTGSRLYEYSQALHKIQNRQNEWISIVDKTKNFDHTRDMVLEKGKTIDTSLYLFQMGQIPQGNLVYSFESTQPYTVQVDRGSGTRQSEDCISISVREQDGSTKQLQIKALDCTIHPNNGTVTISNNPELFDINGVIYKPKQDYEFDLNVSVDNNTNIQQTTTTPLILHSSKKLVVKRSVSLVDTSKVLKNPAFVNELNKRMSISYAVDIKAIEKKDNVIHKTLHSHLEKYPDYIDLPDHQKGDLYKHILGLTQVDTIDQNGNPVVESLFGGNSFANAINAVQVWDKKSNQFVDHFDAFAKYVESKDVDPQATPDDISSEIKYRNRLSRNLTLLTKNYLAYLLKGYLNDVYVTQAVNDQITSYTTDYQNKKLDTTIHTAQNAQNAASTLRHQRPRGASANGLNKRIGRNDSWLRLMADKTSTISDTITMEDGSEKSYTTVLNTGTKGKMFAKITLPDGKNLTLAGPTPGDLLAKILTSARIDESQGGQRMRLMMAFGTLKSLVKLARDAGAPLENIPINGTRDEYRITLDDNDNIAFARYNYNDANDEFEIGTPAFDEQNPDHKLMMTHNFITDLNETLNTVLDSHYDKFKKTMSNGTNMLKRAWRFMTFDRERMMYEADANIFGVRSIRGWMTKVMNRKQNPMQSFDFPIQAGNKQGSVSYDPKGIITITIDGKVRKGKNLAKLVNPWAMRNFFGVFQRKDNMTDGMEMQIMNGLYSQLSSQLMQNDRVSKYTYLARDPQSGVVYACYIGQDAEPRIGIIEHTDQNNMLMFDRQKGGRHVGLPEQGVRELNEKESQAVLSRPEIMDVFLQNMFKSREEIFRLPLGKYRSASLTANVASQLAIAGVAGGIDVLTGGWLSTNTAAAAYATGKFTTGTLLPKAGSVVSNTSNALSNAVTGGWDIARQTTIGLGEGLVNGAGLAA